MDRITARHSAGQVAAKRYAGNAGHPVCRVGGAGIVAVCRSRPGEAAAGSTANAPTPPIARQWGRIHVFGKTMYLPPCCNTFFL